MLSNTLNVRIAGHNTTAIEFSFTGAELNRKIRYDFLTRYQGIEDKNGIEILSKYKEGASYIVDDFIHDVISQLFALRLGTICSRTSRYGKTIDVAFYKKEQDISNLLIMLFGYLKHSVSVIYNVPACEILVHSDIVERNEYLDTITKTVPSKRIYVFTTVHEDKWLTIVWLTNFIGYDFRYKCSVTTYTLNDKFVTDYSVDLKELETLTGLMQNYVKNDKAKDIRQPLGEKDDKQLQDELVLRKDTLYYFDVDDIHSLRVVAHSVLQHRASYYIFKYQSHLLVVISDSISIELQDYISNSRNLNIVSSVIYQSDLEGNKIYGRSFSYHSSMNPDKKEFIALVRKFLKEQTNVVITN